jgi:hypothetical protein
MEKPVIITLSAEIYTTSPLKSALMMVVSLFSPTRFIDLLILMLS